jgi:hypothetical protein
VSSGFGRIMTEQLLARGDRIAGTVRDLSVMNDLKAEYGNRLWLAETASIRGVASTSCANGPSVDFRRCHSVRASLKWDDCFRIVIPL